MTPGKSIVWRFGTRHSLDMTEARSALVALYRGMEIFKKWKCKSLRELFGFASEVSVEHLHRRREVWTDLRPSWGSWSLRSVLLCSLDFHNYGMICVGWNEQQPKPSTHERSFCSSTGDLHEESSSQVWFLYHGRLYIIDYILGTISEIIVLTLHRLLLHLLRLELKKK